MNNISSFRFPPIPIQQGRFPHRRPSEDLRSLRRKEEVESELPIKEITLKLLGKLKTSIECLPATKSQYGTAPGYETVYDVYKLPDGFRAEFQCGVFGFGDIDKLSDTTKEQYKGKELRLVHLSDLEGEAYAHDKNTGDKIPQLGNVYILLVEDKDVPKSNFAKIVYFVMQGLKQEKEVVDYIARVLYPQST